MACNDETAVRLELASRGLMHIENGSLIPISIACSSTPISRSAYTATRELQPELNCVLDRLSRDREFIVTSLESVAAQDEFVRRHLDIYREMTEDHLNKPSLMLNRHDYMFHTDDPMEEGAHRRGQFKLVEFNLSAASMGGLSDGVQRFHRRTSHKTDNNIAGLSEGLVKAHRLYQSLNANSENAVVACIGKKSDFNYFDQQHLINGVNDRGVRMVRYKVEDLTEGLTVDEGGICRVSGQEVSVFYLRSLYDPKHFTSDAVWEMRRQIELSRAIPTPSVAHQIVNMKFFQMVLADKEVLGRYTDRPEEVMVLFHDTLTLALGEEGDQNAQLAINNPERYVMKPQREGGGNNLWEEEMRERLVALRGDPARQQFILMRRITPPVFGMKFYRRGTFTEQLQTVSEVGFFSSYLRSGADVLHNVQHGLLVRTKNRSDNEGGVYVGISVMGSPQIVD